MLRLDLPYKMRDSAPSTMSMEDRSSFLLREFEPSAVRLKRKLRLILTKTFRRDKISEENVTFSQFVFFSSK
jgi:hypothetical protein